MLYMPIYMHVGHPTLGWLLFIVYPSYSMILHFLPYSIGLRIKFSQGPKAIQVVDCGFGVSFLLLSPLCLLELMLIQIRINLDSQSIGLALLSVSLLTSRQASSTSRSTMAILVHKSEAKT